MRLDIENFVIMGNHFHLLIRPLNGSTLPEIMSYNRIHGTWRPFRDRIRHHRSGQYHIISPLSPWMKFLWPEHEILHVGSDPIESRYKYLTVTYNRLIL